MRGQGTLLRHQLPSVALLRVGTHLTHHRDRGALISEPLDGEGRRRLGHDDGGGDAQPPGGIGGRHACVARCQGWWVGSVSVRDGLGAQPPASEPPWVTSGLPSEIPNRAGCKCLPRLPLPAGESRAQGGGAPAPGHTAEDRRRPAGRLPEQQTKCLQPRSAHCGDEGRGHLESYPPGPWESN